MMSIVREVRSGGRIPRWYGLAYVDWARDIGVCYPMPCNLLVSVVRWVWAWCKQGVPQGHPCPTAPTCARCSTVFAAGATGVVVDGEIVCEGCARVYR